MLKDKGEGVVVLRGRVESMLVLPSDLYSELDEILVSDSRSSFCPTYTFLLTTIDYLP